MSQPPPPPSPEKARVEGAYFALGPSYAAVLLFFATQAPSPTPSNAKQAPSTCTLPGGGGGGVSCFTFRGSNPDAGLGYTRGSGEARRGLVGLVSADRCMALVIRWGGDEVG